MSEDPTTPSRPLAEISQGPGAFDQFLDRHQKSLIGLGAVMVLGVAAVLVVRSVKEDREEAAGAAMVRASDSASLQRVASQWPNTNAAPSSRLLLAESLWNEGRQEESIATLRAVVDSASRHPARPNAVVSLASKLLAQGEREQAAELFRQLIDDPAGRHLAPYAMIALGDIARDAGNRDEAERLYRNARIDFPASGFDEAATRHLTVLIAAPPVEVEPPPLTDENDVPPVEFPPIDGAFSLDEARSGTGPGGLFDFTPVEDDDLGPVEEPGSEPEIPDSDSPELQNETAEP